MVLASVPPLFDLYGETATAIIVIIIIAAATNTAAHVLASICTALSYQRRLITSIIQDRKQWKAALLLELIIRRWYQSPTTRCASPRHRHPPLEPEQPTP
jgi:hypothetical protein